MILWMSHNYRKIINILYIPEIVKYIQIEHSLIQTMDLKVVLTRRVL